MTHEAAQRVLKEIELESVKPFLGLARDQPEWLERFRTITYGLVGQVCPNGKPREGGSVPEKKVEEPFPAQEDAKSRFGMSPAHPGALNTHVDFEGIRLPRPQKLGAFALGRGREVCAPRGEGDQFSEFFDQKRGRGKGDILLIRKTNVLESTFAAVRLRTDARPPLGGRPGATRRWQKQRR